MPNPPSAAAAPLAAQAWAEVRDLLDLQLSPLGLRAIRALAPRPGEAILDVGCGTGQSVCQLAELVGPQGRVVGVDIAPTLLDIASALAGTSPTQTFIQGDASTIHLPRHSFDALFSRFGVMAFHDPLAAFTHLHSLLKPTARLGFVCWRALDDNELDALPLRAAGLEDRLDSTPFSFADPARIHDTLAAAGFRRIEVTAHDQAVSSGDLDAMANVLSKVGALGKILRENPALRSDAEPRLRAALAALAARGDPAAVTLTAATWIVTARA